MFGFGRGEMGGMPAPVAALQVEHAAMLAPDAVVEPLMSIDALAVRAEALRKQIYADRAWAATTQPADMGSDLLVGLGVTDFAAVMRARQGAARHNRAA